MSEILVKTWFTVMGVLAMLVIGGLFFGIIVYGILHPHTPIEQTVGLNYIITISGALLTLVFIGGGIVVVWRSK